MSWGVGCASPSRSHTRLNSTSVKIWRLKWHGDVAKLAESPGSNTLIYGFSNSFSKYGSMEAKNARVPLGFLLSASATTLAFPG